jgi:adenosylcobinamide kinase/adenosylcobinamide-phosphate guanylyltransferase
MPIWSVSKLGVITLLIGGARSGKSKFAVELAARSGGKVAFIATATESDEEMKARIAEHRRMRPSSWVTVEEPINVPQWISSHGNGFDTLIIDCIALWLSNCMAVGMSDEAILSEVEQLIDACRRSGCNVIIVSNEVGMGVVPTTPLGRRFRDMAGKVNQLIASQADIVYWLCAGIPVRIKCAS